LAAILAKLHTLSLHGFDAWPVDVEVEVSPAKVPGKKRGQNFSNRRAAVLLGMFPCPAP
jgi:hypothetical protein